jgi:hypothetical protein
MGDELVEDNKNEIIEVLSSVIKENQKTINEICQYAQMGFNFISTGLDGLEVINGTLKIFNGVKIILLREFLNSFYKGISNGKIPSDNDVIKLKKYMNKRKNVIYINRIIDDAVNTRSVKASMILGYYVGQLISKEKDINYMDELIINALRNLFDDDIENFKRVMDYLSVEKLDKNYYTNDYIKDKLQLKDDEIYSIELMIEKLKNFQILGYGVGGFGMEYGVFGIEKISKYFYKLIEDAKVCVNYDEI